MMTISKVYDLLCMVSCLLLYHWKVEVNARLFNIYLCLVINEIGIVIQMINGKHK